MSGVAAVILAGGRSERMGGLNKALLDIGGRRMVDVALAATVGCAPVVLSVGQLDFAVDGTDPVPDLPTDYAGPLAGLAAAVERLRADSPDLLLSLAVDTPFFPPDFLARAEPLIANSAVVLAHWGGQDYPTNALWRFASLRTLPDDVRAGTAAHSLKRLAASIGMTRLDYSESRAQDPFLNANTPEDLAILRARGAAPEPD